MGVVLALVPDAPDRRDDEKADLRMQVHAHEVALELVDHVVHPALADFLR